MEKIDGGVRERMSCDEGPDFDDEGSKVVTNPISYRTAKRLLRQTESHIVPEWDRADWA